MPVSMFVEADIARSLDHELSIRILKPEEEIQRPSASERLNLHLKAREKGGPFNVLEEKCKPPLSTVRTNE